MFIMKPIGSNHHYSLGDPCRISLNREWFVSLNLNSVIKRVQSKNKVCKRLNLILNVILFLKSFSFIQNWWCEFVRCIVFFASIFSNKSETIWNKLIESFSSYRVRRCKITAESSRCLFSPIAVFNERYFVRGSQKLFLTFRFGRQNDFGKLRNRKWR